MAFNIPENVYAYLAGEDLSGKEGYAVMVSADGADPDMAVRLCTQAAAGRFLGLVLYGAQVYNAQYTTPALLTVARSSATIQTGGIGKAVCSAAVSNGDPITVNSDGRLRLAASGEVVVGTALQTTANANDIFALQFAPRPAVLP